MAKWMSLREEICNGTMIAMIILFGSLFIYFHTLAPNPEKSKNFQCKFGYTETEVGDIFNKPKDPKLGDALLYTELGGTVIFAILGVFLSNLKFTKKDAYFYWLYFIICFLMMCLSLLTLEIIKSSCSMPRQFFLDECKPALSIQSCEPGQAEGAHYIAFTEFTFKQQNCKKDYAKSFASAHSSTAWTIFICVLIHPFIMAFNKFSRGDTESLWEMFKDLKSHMKYWITFAVWTICAFILAILVPVQRVNANFHTVLDVSVGSLIGFFQSALVGGCAFAIAYCLHQTEE